MEKACLENLTYELCMANKETNVAESCKKEEIVESLIEHILQKKQHIEELIIS